ncbi:hypothetical protein Tco_1125200 [Tanacetum coccineum]|uniref:Uncharacterized protein n=1 Tax=Tanacetum coccineum TaxID=301880 RepID=A0ABQ5J9S0_9ASTR
MTPINQAIATDQALLRNSHQWNVKPISHGAKTEVNVQTARTCYLPDFNEVSTIGKTSRDTKGYVGLQTRWIEKWRVRIIQYQCFAIEKSRFEILPPNSAGVALTSGLPDNIYGNVKSARPKTLDETIELANDLMGQKLCTYTERQIDNKKKADDSSRNNHSPHSKQPFRGRMVANVTLYETQRKEALLGDLCPSAMAPSAIHSPQWPVHPESQVQQSRAIARDCRRHYKRDYSTKLKNKDGGNGNAQGWVYAVGNGIKESK